MPIKVGMVSLGCAKNQVDAEIMLRLIGQDGEFELEQSEVLAQVIIVNTCGFIGDAKKEAIDNIIEIGQLKKTAALKALIVTGCLAQRYREEILSELPEVDAVVGLGSNIHICDIIKKAVSGSAYSIFGDNLDLPLEGERVLTTPKYTAYLKIADGCDNKCTYCAIPFIRGGYRSRKIENILKEAENLAKNGVKELVLIAQDTTRYGEDIYGEYRLPLLLDRLQEIEELRWIRILYTYPERITDELIAAVRRNDKVLRYLDIPMQHASSDVLRRMNRKGDANSLGTLVEKLRRELPGITIRTTFIVGFPGESERDFEVLAEFVQAQKFSRMGCFEYSPEEGTPAALYEGQISPEVKSRRAEIIMAEQSVVGEALAKSFIGATLDVLVEGYDKLNKCYYGRSKMDAPDIDGKVFFASESPINEGEILKVKIIDTVDYDLVGEI